MRRLCLLGLLVWSAGLPAQTIYIGTRTAEGRSQGIYRARFDPRTGAIGAVALAAATPDPTFLAVHPRRPLLFTVVGVLGDRVRAFAIEPGGGLRLLNEVAAKGTGPAHIQIDRSGRWVATANYRGGTVAVFRIQAGGELSEAVSSVQHEGRAPHPHSVNFSADNTRLFVADLGIDEVRVYAFDASTGSLTAQEPLRTPPGSGPRHVALGKKRMYVVNELSSSVSVFGGGKLLETVGALPAGFAGKSSAAEVLLDRKERFLYASNRGADTIAVFRVAPALVKIADLPVARVPRGIVLSPDGRFLIAASQEDDLLQAYRIDPRSGLLTPAGPPARAPHPICIQFSAW